MNDMSSEDLNALILACNVLQQQITKRRDAHAKQLLSEDPYIKERKTRLLAAYMGELGFRILDYKNKEKPLPEASAAKLMFRIKDKAMPIFKSLAKRENKERILDLSGLSPQEKTLIIQLCEKFKSLDWVSLERTSKKEIKIIRMDKSSATLFWNGGWAEIVNRQMIERTLQAFAKEHKLSYDIFYDVKLMKVESEKKMPDMQLDVIARIDKRFYVFETKTGVLAIDKWVDRAKLFSRDQRGRFVTCCVEEKIPTQWFRPFCLVPLGKLEEQMLKWLKVDCESMGNSVTAV